MMWLGLTYPDGTIKHMTDLYPQAFQPIHRSQQKLGWKHMFYGRFLNQWTHLLRATRPDLDSTKLITKTIVIVWQHLLEVWTAWNDDNNTLTEHFPPNMMSDIHGIYATRDHLPQHTQDRIFQLTKEELLTKPKQYIQNWIQHSKNFISIELKIIAKQQRTNTQDIRYFFQPR